MRCRASASTGIDACFERFTSRRSRQTALLITAGVAAAFFSVIAFSPTFVALALTTGAASAWGAWLERHPEPPFGRQARRSCG